MPEFVRNIGKFKFVAPSLRRKNAKYDVYMRKTGKYITSFGHKDYQQYKDKIGHYRKLDHKDKSRKSSYYKRHGKAATYKSAKYFSHKYLW